MTKGKATLPWRAVAGQKSFFITLVGSRAHDFSGRDDKGKATLPLRAVAGQKAFFITLGGPQAHDSSGCRRIHCYVAGINVA
jgi:hypothetical protein